MKQAKRIDGFQVEVFESVRAGKVWFIVRLQDYPNAMAEADSLCDALGKLRKKWEEISIAYQSSGLKPPKPIRNRRKERIKRTLRWLASRPLFPSDLL